MREEGEKPKIKSCLMVHKTRRKENGKVQALLKTQSKERKGKKEDFTLAVEKCTGRGTGDSALHTDCECKVI